MSNFSDMITYLRKREGMSQKDLAEKLGVSRSTIGMYETGGREPDFETLEAIADTFNVNMDTLLGKPSSNLSSTRILNDDELKVAYFRGADPNLTDEDMDAMWQDAKDFRDFIIQKRNREKYGK